MDQEADRVKIANLGMQKCRILIRKKPLKEDLQIFQVLGVWKHQDKSHDQGSHDIAFDYLIED